MDTVKMGKCLVWGLVPVLGPDENGSVGKRKHLPATGCQATRLRTTSWLAHSMNIQTSAFT